MSDLDYKQLLLSNRLSDLIKIDEGESVEADNIRNQMAETWDLIAKQTSDNPKPINIDQY